MQSLPKLFVRTLALAGTAMAASVPAKAGVGDLLVAPTRIVLDGRTGSEIILNNIGDGPATYRISVELRRMNADGRLEEVTTPSAADKMAQEMIIYSPRRVTLAPNQPQSIRIAARAPQGLADGEYRVHLLFRAIPDAKPVAAAAPADTPKGLSFAITPIYGVTIPVIVRLGQLQVKAGIANVHLAQQDGKKAVGLDLIRSGQRSTFGEVRVLKPGVKDPIAIQRSVAVYTDVGSRKLVIPVSEEFKGDLRGPVTVQYVETMLEGNRTIAETQAVLQ
ncbi:molecular chaperone [Sphingomonas piscis]|uniref:Molecular chaperone n=1 Tax=Sphingomonas piscis TaxID=2714943 RepID=A0A6G7YPR1_9SPHN|nr:molecular chaperone [Sphingomonas piscis]QIK78716.1 molecular chaperone [Sphingomonas piscis]